MTWPIPAPLGSILRRPWARAAASRSEGCHAALSVAMALGAVAVEPSGMQGFVTSFLARWGRAVGRDRRRRQP